MLEITNVVQQLVDYPRSEGNYKQYSANSAFLVVNALSLWSKDNVLPLNPLKGTLGW